MPYYLYCYYRTPGHTGNARVFFTFLEGKKNTFLMNLKKSLTNLLAWAPAPPPPARTHFSPARYARFFFSRRRLAATHERTCSTNVTRETKFTSVFRPGTPGRTKCPGTVARPGTRTRTKCPANNKRRDFFVFPPRIRLNPSRSFY